MKERRKNIQKFTLLSDDQKMNESTTNSQRVSTTSGDEGFEEPPADRKDESTRSTTDRTTQSTTRTESSESSVTKVSPARSGASKKRTKDKPNQEAVIMPRRRKLPSRTSNRALNDVILAVELAADFRKPGSRSSRLNSANTKERVLVNHDDLPESPESIEIKSTAMSGVTANRDRLFGGEPEPKARKTVRRKRRPKPDDNSSKNVYWWIGTNEDEEPPVGNNKTSRVSIAGSGNPSNVQQILSGSSASDTCKSLPIRNRRGSYRLRDDDTSAKLFGVPEARKQLTKARPGDASHNHLFGSESEGLPLTPRMTASNGRLKSDVTRERLFGEKTFLNARPLAKNFPDKLVHEDIFAPTESLTRDMNRTARAKTVRNPIVGEAAQPSRTKRDSGITGANPITGEGYLPVKRDIHAVTCRI
uniref:Uncharacterized protein n=1 Tax=Strigamia maritima TaxID=126957 RepID=T1JLG0_STRMM